VIVESITAIATAAGKGGIGVVRISGPAATKVAGLVCSVAVQLPRQATYCAFVDDKGQPIDHGIAVLFKAPASFTGEDVLELQGHGGPVVMQLLLNRVLQAGRDHAVRLASPGEFTQRAFLNDKLDLAQAEAVADLIDASTEQAARLATRSLEGDFSKQVMALVERLIRLRMLVEATLDFPDEEIDFLEAADALGQLHTIEQSLSQLRAQAKQGALLRNGLNVVLVGEPNVGKSSLLNALAGAEVAIVTPIAGTTRDKVVQTIAIEGVALNIIDTAGLRATQDMVEQIGIERTWDEVARADLVLHLRAINEAAIDGNLLEALRKKMPRQVPLITVINKVDLVKDQSPSSSQTGQDPMVYLSAKTGQGLDQLRTQLLAAAGWQTGGETLFLARERHLIALSQAHEHLVIATHHAAQGNQHLDVMAEELRLAQAQLSSITGEFTADDLLGEIFSRFCIGK
jgi:tRNA modification GTPase